MTEFWIGLGVGAVLVILGGLVGMGLMVVDYAKVSRQRANGEPFCACRHHAVYHDGTGKCHKDKISGTCECMKYIGPKPKAL